MQSTARDHLATMTPIQSGQGRRIMTIPSLLMHNAVFVALQTGWMVVGAIGWMLVQLPTEAERAIGVVCLWLMLTWLVAQFVIVFVYPEWPMNRWLAARLRRSVLRRNDRPVWATNPDNRIVEFVPRDRWNQMFLDTATDLMMIRIDSAGVHMEGDCFRYELPCESILGVELHSIRPSGWFTNTHMVIIYARTIDGPLELPISYRDHQFGDLRNSRRRQQAFELVDQINAIAAGGIYGPLVDPTPRAERSRDGVAELRGGVRRDSLHPSPAAAQASPVNPYQAPTTL